MKLLFISDIHYETWWDGIYSQLAMKKKLEWALSHWFLSLPYWEEKDVVIILGWDFFSSYSLFDICKLHRKIEEWKAKSSEKIIQFTKKLFDEIYVFLENEGAYQIKDIIISPGNHELWSTWSESHSGLSKEDKALIKAEVDSVMSIDSLSQKVLSLLAAVVKSITGKKPIVQQNFSTSYELTPWLHITSSALFAPLRQVPMVYEDKEAFLNQLFSFKMDRNYEYFLSREMDTWKGMENIFVEEPDFTGFNDHELEEKLYEEYRRMLEYHMNSELKYTEEYPYYRYYSKMFLYFMRELSSIFQLSQSLPENCTLIINNHFPFFVRDFHEKFFDNFTFSARSLYSSDNTWGLEAQFFNIDTSWLIFLLDRLKQNSVIFLEGHTHEQYSFSFNYNNKSIFWLNNNLWYGG